MLNSSNLNLCVYDSLFECQKCKYIFHKIEELALHSCSVEKLNTCHGCGKQFPGIGLLALHKCSNKVSYQCYKCQKAYYEIYEFVLHECFLVVPLVCYDCETMFSDISALALHKCISPSSVMNTYSSLEVPLNTPILKTDTSSSSIICSKSVFDGSNSLIKSIEINVCDKLNLDNQEDLICERLSLLHHESLCLSPLKSTEINSNTVDKSTFDNLKVVVDESFSVPFEPLITDNALSVPLFSNPPKKSQSSFGTNINSGFDNQQSLDCKSSSAASNPQIEDTISSELLEPIKTPKSKKTSSNINDKDAFDDQNAVGHKAMSAPFNSLIKDTEACASLVPLKNSISLKTSSNRSNESVCDNSMLVAREPLSVTFNPLIGSAIANVCDKSARDNLKPLFQGSVSGSLNHLKESSFNTNLKSCINYSQPLVLNSLSVPLKRSFIPILPKRVFNCDQCAEFYSDQTALDTHHKQVHTIVHKCDICFCTFSCAQKLFTHKKSHTVKQLLRVKTTSGDKGKAIDKQKLSKDKSIKRYRCFKCDRIFYNKQALNRHKNAFKGIFSCNPNLQYREHLLKTQLIASPLIVPPENLTKNAQTHNVLHDNQNMLVNVPIKEMSCVCNVCNKGYSKQRARPSKVQYECDICHKVFLCKLNLNLHKCDHKTTELVVPINSKKEIERTDILFSASQKLLPIVNMFCTCKKCAKLCFKQDASIYPFNRQYKCNICHKAFLCNWNLYRHKQLLHSGSAPQYH